jgi:hypothetical protein
MNYVHDGVLRATQKVPKTLRGISLPLKTEICRSLFHRARRAGRLIALSPMLRGDAEQELEAHKKFIDKEDLNDDLRRN